MITVVPEAHPDRREPEPGDHPMAVWVWWGAVAAVTFLTWRETFGWLDVIHPDVAIGRSAAHVLLGPDRFHVYALSPRAQMGPGAILLSLLPRSLYLLLVGGLVGPVLVRLVDAGLAVSGRALTPAVALSAAFGAWCCVRPWSELAGKGHADDALVLAGAALMLPSRRPEWLRFRPAGVAVAALGKPTVVLLLPLTVGWEPVAAMAAVGLVTLVWLPFVVVDPAGFLAAGRGVMVVGPHSLPTVVGYLPGSPPPAWIRCTQLGGGALLAGFAVARGRPLHALLAAFALRALVDPNPAPAYCISVIVLAVGVDVSRRYPLPWATVAAVIAFQASADVLAGGPGGLRIGVLAVLLSGLLLEIGCGWLLAVRRDRKPMTLQFDPSPHR